MNDGEALVLDGRGARLSFSALGVDAHAFWNEPGLKRVQEYLRQHLELPFPLARAAELAGLEYTYFSEFFHRRVGITFVRWVNALRVSRALELLIDTDLPISEIAARIGYRDERTLQRNFKQLTGHQPKALRRTFRAMGGKGGGDETLGRRRRRRDGAEADPADYSPVAGLEGRLEGGVEVSGEQVAPPPVEADR
jgi:AraC-like DNA-binding protein